MEIRAVKFRVGHEWRLGCLYHGAGDGPAPAVLMLHGFPGVQKNEDIAAELCRRGMTVFMPYFCGCWGSSGRFSVAGLFNDSRTALRLLSRYRRVDAERIGLLGYSFGGWAALRLASESPVAAAAALAPAVPHGDEAGDARYLRRNAKVVNMPRLDEVWEEYVGAARRDRPDVYLPKISPAPLLLVQGLKDRVVPPLASSRLWRLAAHPKELVELPDEEHEFQNDRLAVIEKVCAWFESRLTPAPQRRVYE